MPEFDDLQERLRVALQRRLGGDRTATDLAPEVFRRARTRFARSLNRLVADIEANDLAPADAVDRIIVFAVRDLILDNRDLDADAKDALAKRVAQRLRDDPSAVLEAIRHRLRTPDDEHRTGPFAVLVEDVVTTASTSEPNNPVTEGEHDMEELDALLEELHEAFAFDEAQLPKRLHYGRADGGEQVLSDGQRNFLAGAVRALHKLGVDVLDDDDEGHRRLLVVIASVVGILLLDGHHDPDERSFFENVKAAYMELLSPASSSRPDIIAGDDRFNPEFDQKLAVFGAVGTILAGKNGRAGMRVFFDAYASVARGMADSYDTRPPGSAGFGPAVLARYNDTTLAGGGGAGGGGGTGIAFLDLPPLHDPAGEDDEIVPENIAAIAAIYVVYQCEQLLLFKTVDRIVELFMAGLLPMGGDSLARKLDDYYWNKEDQVSENGRYNNYARALGAPDGEVGPDAPRNSEFNVHLMRCVSTIAAVQSESSYANLFDERGRNSTLTKGEYARKALRDWAANCTLYGYAGAQFAAERLGRQLRQAMEILQLPRIKEIYGVNTMWQVIERVAQSEFGVTVNVVKHRTLAEETRSIMQVLADRHHIWSQSTGLPLFSVGGAQGDLDEPTTNRLFRSAQYFLAVNGVEDTSVRDYSQPVETPALPSVPSFGSFGGGGGGLDAGVGAGIGADIAGKVNDVVGQGIAPSAGQINNIFGAN